MSDEKKFMVGRIEQLTVLARPMSEGAKDLHQQLLAAQSELQRTKEELERAQQRIDVLELPARNYNTLLVRAESAEAKLAAMAEALKKASRIHAAWNRNEEVNASDVTNLRQSIHQALHNLPERAKLLMAVLEAAIGWEQADRTLKGLVPASIRLEEEVRAYQSAKDK